jgi:dTDP-4-amino-4,6-dideoxygalactose transaminase
MNFFWMMFKMDLVIKSFTRNIQENMNNIKGGTSSMKIPLLDLSKQYSELESLINNALLKVASSAKYIMGPEVNAFESEMADFLEAKYAISCANGTDALILSLKALGVGPGDEVITTPFTFFATAEAISSVGATPIFVDVQEDSCNIDVSKIEERITFRTKAIMPVHIFGLPVEMDEIRRIAIKHKLYIIEDACQAIGSTYKESYTGTIGDVGCFSFFPTKNLGAFGDGGMVVTNNEQIAQIIRGLRVHGSGIAGLHAFKALHKEIDESESELVSQLDETSAKYYNYIIGYNSRLDEIQAAVLRVKLKHLNNWNTIRRNLAEKYSQKLQKTSLKLPITIDNIKEVVHLYVVKSDNRVELAAFLNEKGISTGVYYPIPLHLQKVYSGLGYKLGDFPVSEYLSQSTLALPLYPELTEDEQNYIIDCIYQFESRN